MKPNRLDLDKILIHSMKSSQSGIDLSALFSVEISLDLVRQCTVDDVAPLELARGIDLINGLEEFEFGFPSNQQCNRVWHIIDF